LEGLPQSFDPKRIEEEVRALRDEIRRIVEERRKDAEEIGFVEGPPTLNGRPHMGHIRGRVLKDIWYRFNTMKGKRVVFRAGWDTQGLPVELEAEKELGLTGSKYENLKLIGEEKLVEACQELIKKYYRSWREADSLLGMSFDYEHEYMTYRDEYIEREWQYLKRALELGVLEEGYRVVAYCPSCQTSLSHAEVSQSYEMVEDPSLYYKVKLKDEDAYLIVWTTMPFTVVTDELIGVKPDASYLYVKVGDEVWIVGKDRLKELMEELGLEYEVIKEVKGLELEGKRYEHPLLDLIDGLKGLEGKIHYVVAEDFVDTSTGTGIVHMSPANGEEDFKVATKRGVPIFNPIDDRVYFTEEAGAFKGRFVRDADEMVIEKLRERGHLVKVGKLVHKYPTCWRSHHKLVWVARKEYFYRVDRLGDLPLKAAEGVEYYYEQPKNRFLEIIKERVPWCISRERVWGAPLPIWVCSKCGTKVYAFSRKEIEEKALELPEGGLKLHRPWIDKVVLKCPKCGGRAYRVPFVLDTWHNSGAAPYAGFSDEEYEKFVPVPFLTEGIDQTRGWAYTLLIENVIMKGKPEAPFKSFLFQGHVLDEHGNKMSKSLGNIIDGIEAMKSYPVDALRFYLVWKGNPIDSITFSFKELMKRPYQVLNTLYHMHVYLVQNGKVDGFEPRTHSIDELLKGGELKEPDRWILSRLQKLVRAVEVGIERCRHHEAARSLERFIIEDLSQRYIPAVRQEIWDDRAETLKRRLSIYGVLSECLLTVDKLLHPIAPYLTEYLYLKVFGDGSILVSGWPKVREELIDEGLERDMELAYRIVSVGNYARNLVKLKRRWPLKEARVFCARGLGEGIRGLEWMLKSLMNVKELKFFDGLKGLGVRLKVRPNYGLLGPRFKDRLPKLVERVELEGERVYLELARRGRASIRLDREVVELGPEELEFEVEAEEGLVAAEDSGLIVVLNLERDRSLEAEGLVRDLARRLQALRKEKGYRPTEVLEVAAISGLSEEQESMVRERLEELAYLVRVKRVELVKDAVGGEWVEKDVDGVPLKFLIR